MDGNSLSHLVFQKIKVLRVFSDSVGATCLLANKGVLVGICSVFVVQNEAVKNSSDTQLWVVPICPKNYPHRVIHIVEKFAYKKLVLKINYLKKLSTFSGKLTLTNAGNPLLSLPHFSRFFYSAFPL
ncbi:MAG: hypothetical protein SFV22_12185 [Saprospiraceae bacterium]|nr:hypothetical protein [Saprospiraceae bacterium]